MKIQLRIFCSISTLALLWALYSIAIIPRTNILVVQRYREQQINARSIHFEIKADDHENETHCGEEEVSWITDLCPV